MDLTLIYKKGMKVSDTWYKEWGIGVITKVLKTRIYVDFDIGDCIQIYDTPHLQFLKIEGE